MNNSVSDKPSCINSWDMFSKYRTVLMGCAIFGIVLCHVSLAQTHNGISPSVFTRVLSVFSAMVDVFLFLSGLGLYYSRRKKSRGGGYWSYIKRRWIKIVPIYLVIGTITYMIKDIIIEKETFWQVLKDLFFVTWFSTGSTRFWFVLAILVFYALFPAIYIYFQKDDERFQRLLILVAGYVITAGILHLLYSHYDWLMIAIERLPIFVVGIYCGKLSFEKSKIPQSLIIVISVTAIISIFLYYTSGHFSAWVTNIYFVYYFLRAIWGLWMCFAIIFVLGKLAIYWPRGHECLISIFSSLGKITLEIYLFHQSYLIIFDYPCSLIGYSFVAVILPIISANLVYMIKNRLKLSSRKK